MIIAIDGLAASGKTSVSAALAARLGFDCVNSGLLYRAITWAVVRTGLDPADSTSIAEMVRTKRFRIGFESGSQVIECEGLRLTDALTQPAVNASVAIVSQFPVVRQKVGNLLREAAVGRNCVVEGRDIGTAVYPDAEHKFFLDASPAIRQRRRDAEGMSDAVGQRDEKDRARTLLADGAIFVDTGRFDLEGVVNFLLEQLAARGVTTPVQGS